MTDQPTRKQDLPRPLRFHATLFETTVMREWLLDFLTGTGALVELGRMTPAGQLRAFVDAHRRSTPEGSYTRRGSALTGADLSTLLTYLKGTVPDLSTLVGYRVSTMQGPATQGTGGNDDD